MIVQCVFSSEDPKPLPEDECYQLLMDLVDMNLSVLNGKDPSALDESIRTNLNSKIFLECARKCYIYSYI